MIDSYVTNRTRHAYIMSGRWYVTSGHHRHYLFRQRHALLEAGRLRLPAIFAAASLMMLSDDMLLQRHAAAYADIGGLPLCRFRQAAVCFRHAMPHAAAAALSIIFDVYAFDDFR